MEPNVHLETPLFKSSVKEYLKRFPEISLVVETGTNDGSGSTSIFADLGLKVKTCEVKFSNYLKAINLFEGNKNVECFHSFTTSREDGDFLYTRDLTISGEDPETDGWLASTVGGVDFNETLFFLDSHWTMGFKEFSIIYREFYGRSRSKLHLILDDATNLKHRPTMLYVKKHELTDDILEKERWAILTFNGV